MSRPSRLRRKRPGEGGGARASVVLLLTVLLLGAAVVAWWLLVPAELDPFPQLRSRLSGYVSGNSPSTEEPESRSVYRESPAVRQDARRPAGEDAGEEDTGGLGTGALAGSGAATRPDGAFADDPTEAGMPTSEGASPRVFTAMTASSRSVDGPFDPHLAGDGMILEWDDFRIPYAVFGVYVTPGQEVAVRLAGNAPPGIAAGEGELYAEAGAVRPTGADAWIWTAPAAPGIYRLDAARSLTGEAIRLNAFVVTPASRIGSDGALGEYRIGAYPDKPLRGLAQYLPPPGFIEVTPENRDRLVSPHFTLGQFLCKQAGGWPKYVTLREEMLGKLETILAGVNARGIRADTFFVMSGFRTPFYNRSIGNVGYSRHMWGDASDIFVDVAPQDGVMDDLDGDGKVGIEDARHLAALVEDLALTHGWSPYVGGLGIYGTTTTHGPFIHVDTRGFKARWSS